MNLKPISKYTWANLCYEKLNQKGYSYLKVGNFLTAAFVGLSPEAGRIWKQLRKI